MYDKSSVKAQNKIRKEIEFAGFDYHDLLDTSPNRVKRQDYLEGGAKYARGTFLDGRVVEGEVVEQSPTSITILENGRRYTIKASDVLMRSNKPLSSDGSLSAKIAAAEGEVDTNPSEGQKEAGNYKKGHIRIGAFDISIEQPKGSVRRGVDANGKAWESKMHNTYGYFRGTEGVDGDHIDVFVSNDIDGWNGQKVFVVDQYNPDGTFDEHKVMLGFNDAEDAKSDYLANYEKGWEDGRRLDVSATNLEDFEKWLASSHRKTKPFGEYKGVKRTEDITPIGKGEFGDIYDQFRGKSQEAIAFLLKKRGGEALGALHHKDIGDIDLVWGVEGTAKSDGYGLAKLAKFHPEVLDNLQAILNEMEVKSRSANRVKLENETHQAAVRLTWNDKSKTWLLTAFEKKEKSAPTSSRTDVASNLNGKSDDTATRQDADFSEGKVSESSEKEQGEVEKKKRGRGKIDDFGEKIGGARKDKARERILALQGMSDADLRRLGVEGVLSQKEIVKAVGDGRMSQEDGVVLSAAYRVSEFLVKYRGGDVFYAPEVYRQLATQWANGEALDVEGAREQFSKVMPQDSFYKNAFESYVEMYKSLNFPTRQYTRMGPAFVAPYGRDDKYWYLSKISARSGNVFSSRDEALSYFLERHPVVDGSASKEKTKKRGLGGLSVTRSWPHKIKSRYIPGDVNVVDVLFTSKSEAEEYLSEHLEELLEEEKRLERELMGRHVGARVRVGKDWRDGRDASEEDFLDFFGFRGVEFGNWVNQSERLRYMNHAYDGFMDLSALLGVSPRSLSLGGTLGLAFGARGGGKASAHYERSLKVINLTRTNGAGALAHEWFHALDNFLHSSVSGDSLSYASDDTSGLRNELRVAFDALLDKMNELDYSRRSKRAGDYWGSRIERMARAFEDYVESRLQEDGVTSSILTRENAGAELDAVQGTSYPLLSVEERAVLRPYFDALFETMQEREDEEGRRILYHKHDDGVAARDAAYADAVARGDMETAERMLAEEAARKGYMMESDYQGTSAFNGAAPSENGYYESLEERKAAFDEEDFEGDWTLADELVRGFEMGLEERITANELYRADRLRREAIQNLRNVRARVNAGEKDVRITMYRSVPAGVVEGEFRNGDWVTPSRLYAEDNAALHGGYPGWENGYRIIEQEVPIEHVWWDGNDVAEWGYDNGREEVYKNVANNRKSFSVTYDADGVLIPLSKRFDEGVSDVSYHKGDDVVVGTEEAELRDGVVELMRNAGIDVVVDSEEGQRVLDMENGGVRLEENMESVNARFNDELGRYQRGEMGENEMFHLGKPEGVMREFLPELPIVMRQRILKKGSVKKHNVAIEGLVDMPKYLSHPIFVFKRSENVLGVLTELEDRDGKNVCIAIELSREIQKGGEILEVNDVRSVHGRNIADIVYPIVENGTLEWVDKEKGLAYLSSASRSVQQEIDKKGLSSAAKVVKDFENPKLVVKKSRFFRTADGKAYGFTVDGKVYLDPKMAGVETAVHEYTHLWADALRRVNPAEWRNVVELMKGTSVWDEVKRNYPELESEDEIADEVLAHYSGRRGAAKLRAALDVEMEGADGVFERARVVSAFERMKRALARFWKGVADFWGVHFDSAEEVADMVLWDLLRGRKLGMAEKGVSMVGRSLSAEEAKELVSMMEENAAPVRELELTRENWDAEFGADGVVQTPLGEVKMGEHQYEKLEQQGRRGKLGMVKPTLESPDVVIEDKSRAKEGEETERGSSYVFVKAFTKEDGERMYYFTSVTVSRDGKEVVVSNQEKRKTGIASLSQKGKVVWMRSDNASTLSDEEQGFYNSQAEKSELATRGTVNPQTTSSAAKVDKSSENGKGEDIFSMAERIAEETKREQRAQRNARYHREGGSVEYGQAVSRAAYEQRMASGAFQSREALQDSMLSLREAMDLILHEGKHGKGWRVEDVSDLENAYMGENRLSSVNSAEQEAFTREVFKPMLGAVAKLAETEEERMVLTDYLMAKHGLERNRVMAEREGLKAYETYVKKHPESKREAEEFIAKARERDYAGLTALTGVEDVSGAEMEAAKMVEEFEEKG